MTDGEPPFVNPAGQGQPLIKEARLARMEAEDAIDRIQQRIERLVTLSNSLDGAQGDDGLEPSASERELAPSARRPD